MTIQGSGCEGVELTGALGLAPSRSQGSSGKAIGAGTEASAGAAATSGGVEPAAGAAETAGSVQAAARGVGALTGYGAVASSSSLVAETCAGPKRIVSRCLSASWIL